MKNNSHEQTHQVDVSISSMASFYTGIPSRRIKSLRVQQTVQPDEGNIWGMKKSDLQMVKTRNLWNEGLLVNKVSEKWIRILEVFKILPCRRLIYPAGLRSTNTTAGKLLTTPLRFLQAPCGWNFAKTSH